MFILCILLFNIYYCTNKTHTHTHIYTYIYITYSPTCFGVFACFITIANTIYKLHEYGAEGPKYVGAFLIYMYVCWYSN